MKYVDKDKILDYLKNGGNVIFILEYVDEVTLAKALENRTTL